MQTFIPSPFVGVSTTKLTSCSTVSVRRLPHMVAQHQPKSRINPTPLPVLPSQKPAPPSQTLLPEVTIDPSLFAHKVVILTGATGFVGSVILYKLLHSCPDSHIVLLARPEVGPSSPDHLPQRASMRVWRMLASADAFAPLRASRSLRELRDLFRERVTVVDSDLVMPRLGISEDDWQTVRNLASSKQGVKIVHCGGSVKFHDRLHSLIDTNVHSVVQFMRLADELGDTVENFVYVSTAYVSAYQAGLDIRVSEFNSVEERRLVQGAGPSTVEEVVSLSPSDVVAIEERISSIFPNNYVYSKLLSETLLESWATGRGTKKPVLSIIRPATICAARQEPSPGFVSSRDAFCAILAAYGRGLLQRFPFSRNHHLDIVPVDVVANTVLLAGLASHTASHKFVVHAASSARASIPLYDLFAGAQEIFRSQTCFPGSVLPCVPASRLLKREDESVEAREEFSAEYRRAAKLAAKVEKQYCTAFSYFLNNSWVFEDRSLRLMQSASPRKVSEVLPTSVSKFEEEFPKYMQDFAAGVLRMILSDAKEAK